MWADPSLLEMMKWWDSFPMWLFNRTGMGADLGLNPEQAAQEMICFWINEKSERTRDGVNPKTHIQGPLVGVPANYLERKREGRRLGGRERGKERGGGREGRKVLSILSHLVGLSYH